MRRDLALMRSLEGAPRKSMDLVREFPILERSTFLNHAAVAPLPRRALDALAAYAEDAALGATAWPRMAARLKAAREAAGRLLGVPANEIGFVHNTTHGLLCMANSLPWRAGDNLVTAEHEFPANVQPWRQLGERGVARRVVAERPDHAFSIDDFAAAIDGRTRLVAVSMVQYSTGLRMPVEALAELCRERGVLLGLDAIQAIGAMPTRPTELGCDFLAADGHKWMLGPEGLGILWMRPELSDSLNASMTGWVGRVRSWDYDDHAQPLHPGARRFEEGSYNMAGAAALGAALEVINEFGIENVWGAVEALTARLAEGAARLGVAVASPRADGQRSGIVALDLGAGADPVATATELGRRGIHVAARRGWLRVSPHFYNRPDQIDALLAALSEILAR
jgi:selenocysteine lyase/cysteine desulfurase